MANETQTKSQCCRTCMTISSHEMIDIYTPINSLSVVEMITSCTAIKVSKVLNDNIIVRFGKQYKLMFLYLRNESTFEDNSGTVASFSNAM